MKTLDKMPKKTERKPSSDKIYEKEFATPSNKTKLQGEIFKCIDSLQAKLSKVDRELKLQEFKKHKHRGSI